MYIFIDNTKTEETAFFVFYSDADWRKEIFNDDGEGSLERSFEKVLNKYNANYEDVKGIAVRVGKGRFTATRLAITFVNTLALALKIPVVAVNEDEPEEILRKIKNAPLGKYAEATYSGEPRVGGKD